MKKKPTQPSEEPKKDGKEDLGAIVMEEKKYYEESTQQQRTEWDDLYDLYIGKLPPSKHKSLSRNFIPKVHQAVETMASFLAGNNPTLFATPVGSEDADKAFFIAKLLEYQMHQMHMKPKILTWVKSGCLFGVGILKLGWDVEDDNPFSYPVNIADFFTSPYERDLQRTHSVIERLILPLADVEQRYGVKNLIPISTPANNLNDSSMFDAKDLQVTSRTAESKVELLERWTKDKIVTVIVQPEKDADGNITSKGLMVKERPNRCGFIPYFSFHYADSPLPNRFYTIGMVAPVARTQKRMNQLLNQQTDNVNLMMNPTAKVRKGSGINTKEMVRYPSRAIFMSDIQRDMEWDVVPDTTQTGYRLLQYLDSEFQRGTSVTDLRQGVGTGGTAAEARIQQGNLSVTTNLVKENLEDALSVFGTHLVKLNMEYITSNRSLRIFDPSEVFDFEQKVGMRPMDPMNPTQPLPMGLQEMQDIKKVGREFKIDKGTIQEEYDIRVQTDSTLSQNKDVMRKQFQDWLTFLSGLGVKVDVQEATNYWGQLSGIPQANKFIDKKPEPPAPPKPDPTKVLVGVADLVKAGAEVYPNQVQAALMAAGLPMGKGNPIVTPDVAQQANASIQGIQDSQNEAQQMAAQNGEDMGLPTPTETSSGVTPQGQQDMVSAAQPSALTQ